MRSPVRIRAAAPKSLVFEWKPAIFYFILYFLSTVKSADPQADPLDEMRKQHRLDRIGCPAGAALENICIWSAAPCSFPVIILCRNTEVMKTAKPDKAYTVHEHAPSGFSCSFHDSSSAFPEGGGCETHVNQGQLIVSCRRCRLFAQGLRPIKAYQQLLSVDSAPWLEGSLISGIASTSASPASLNTLTKASVSAPLRGSCCSMLSS